MIVLSADVVFALLEPSAVTAAVEASLRAQDEKQCVVPQRLHVEWQGNTFLAMPAVGVRSAGVKVVSVVPGNAARDLPVTIGVMVLTSAETGVPLAVINAAALTAIRTGAVGALGVKYMTPRDSTSVGIIGCGVQGTWQAISACAVRPIREVFAVTRSTATLARFTTTLAQYVPNVRVVPCKDARELLDRTQIVIAATTSARPVLPDEPALVAGKHFISVGSYRTTMQELPDAVYQRAGELAIDSDGARHEAGDVVNMLEKGILRNADVYTIGELVSGRRTVNTERTTAYKTVGNGLFDLFVAQALHDEALRRGAGVEVAL